MTRYEFIFSDKLIHRLLRHFAFWLLFALHVCLFRYYVADLKYLADPRFYLLRLQNLLLFLPGSVFYAYFAIYFLLPHYILKERYQALLLIVVVLAVLLCMCSYLVANFISVRLAFDMPLSRATNVRRMDFIMSNGLVYPLTVSGFAIGIKMGKNFYLQEKQNALLAKQKITAEVLLLKSEVHPRFLFHSLTNIYNAMRNGSEQSAGMLLRLSDLLSYILYESDDKAVPLQRELTLLQNYIELEQPGWGGRLSFSLHCDNEASQQLIAPLMLLPVVEFVFEQANKTGDSLSLVLTIVTTGNTCRFFFTAGGDARPGNESASKNIHLEQVQKRLAILYPEKHQFGVQTGKDEMTIALAVEIEN